MSEKMTVRELSEYSTEASASATATAEVLRLIKQGAITEAERLDAVADAIASDMQS